MYACVCVFGARGGVIAVRSLVHIDIITKKCGLYMLESIRFMESKNKPKKVRVR